MVSAFVGGALSRESTEKPKLLAQLFAAKGHRVLVVFLLYISSIGLLAPFAQTLVTDYFASQHAGTKVTCLDYTQTDLPDFCKDAHSDAVLWNSMRSVLTNALLSLYLNPTLGTWSDVYGRKPFILLGCVVGLLPLLALLFHTMFDATIIWWYVGQMISTPFTPFVGVLAYMGDIMSPEYRTVTFAIVMVMFALGIFLGAAANITGLITKASTAAIAGLVILDITILLVIFWVPESLGTNIRDANKEALAAKKSAGGPECKSGIQKAWLSFWHSVRIIFRSDLFRKLTFCFVAIGMVVEEFQDFLLQYLQEVAGFGVQDQATFFMIFGITTMVQPFVLVLLVSILKIPETKVLALSLLATVIQCFAYAFCTSKVVAFMSASLSFLGGLSFPVVSSIKSKNVSVEEQGSVQGAVVGARALAQGIGPIIFMGLYIAFRSSDKFYFPGAPFVFAGLLVFAALVVSLLIKEPPQRQHSMGFELGPSEETASLVANPEMRGETSI